MTLDERRSEAERRLRRGDLRGAMESYEALASNLPDDAAIAQRLHAIRGLVQQGELQGGKATAEVDSGAPTLASEAEAAASRGELVEALALYRRALGERPDSALYLERMQELVVALRARETLATRTTRLAATPGPANAIAPVAPVVAVAPVVRVVPVAAMARVALATPRAAAEEPPLPSDPIERLQRLLSRIRARRRTP